jgi:hypothetical protein
VVCNGALHILRRAGTWLRKLFPDRRVYFVPSLILRRVLEDGTRTISGLASIPTLALTALPEPVRGAGTLVLLCAAAVLVLRNGVVGLDREGAEACVYAKIRRATEEKGGADEEGIARLMRGKECTRFTCQYCQRACRIKQRDLKIILLALKRKGLIKYDGLWKDTRPPRLL